MTIHRTFASALLGATLLMGTAALQAPLHAATSGIEAFAGDDPTSFASPEEAVTAFTASLAAGDLAERLHRELARVSETDCWEPADRELPSLAVDSVSEHPSFHACRRDAKHQTLSAADGDFNAAGWIGPQRFDGL